MMDENNNLNRTDSGQPQNEYTGEYGNSVETDGSADSVYSYSYKNGAKMQSLHIQVIIMQETIMQRVQ